MISKATKQFWKLYEALPVQIQQRATLSYRLWRENPRHPGIRFKQVHRAESIYSARVNSDYRALALLEKDTVTWFWIGSHEEYERLLKQL